MGLIYLRSCFVFFAFPQKWIADYKSLFLCSVYKGSKIINTDVRQTGNCKTEPERPPVHHPTVIQQSTPPLSPWASSFPWPLLRVNSLGLNFGSFCLYLFTFLGAFFFCLVSLSQPMTHDGQMSIFIQPVRIHVSDLLTLLHR